MQRNNCYCFAQIRNKKENQLTDNLLIEISSDSPLKNFKLLNVETIEVRCYEQDNYIKIDFSNSVLKSCVASETFMPVQQPENIQDIIQFMLRVINS